MYINKFKDLPKMTGDFVFFLKLKNQFPSTGTDKEAITRIPANKIHFISLSFKNKISYHEKNIRFCKINKNKI